MIHRLAQRIAEYCVDGTDADREIVAYGLECRISDLAQIMVLVLAGVGFQCMGELLSFGVCFTLLKRNVGGYHCATHATCIGLFSVVSVLASKLAACIPEKWSVFVSFTGMCAALGLVIWRAPIAHPNHPKSQAAHARSRRASVWLAISGIALLPLVSARFPAVGLAGALGGLTATSTLVIPIPQERRVRE